MGMSKIVKCEYMCVGRQSKPLMRPNAEFITCVHFRSGRCLWVCHTTVLQKHPTDSLVPLGLAFPTALLDADVL